MGREDLRCGSGARGLRKQRVYVSCGQGWHCRLAAGLGVVVEEFGCEPPSVGGARRRGGCGCGRAERCPRQLAGNRARVREGCRADACVVRLEACLGDGRVSAWPIFAETCISRICSARHHHATITTRRFASRRPHPSAPADRPCSVPRSDYRHRI